MMRKRLWIVLMAVPACLAAMLVIGSEKSHQATASSVIDPTCTSVAPCIEYDNTGTGPGIRGVSLAGNGVGASTKFNSTSPSNGRAGVFGTDVSTSGTFNSGVFGLSNLGNGVRGKSSSGAGVFGFASTGSGVFAAATAVS
jgi:hypothetical protein